MQINLKDFNFLIFAISYINEIYEEIVNYQNYKINEFQKLYEDINNELNFSLNLLETAKIYENQKFIILTQEEIELSNALSEEAAAIASGNPAAIAAASAYVAKKIEDVSLAKNEYEKAKENRFNMEKRVEICKQAMQEIINILETSNNIFASQNATFNFLKEIIISKFTQAYEAIMRYYNNSSYIESLNIIKPNNLNTILNLDNKKAKEYFDFFYKSDINFKKQVDKLKNEYKNAKNDFEKERVLLKIRQNLVGVYAEKYIQTSLSSLGEVYTQHTQAVDGSYSKVDILIKNVKKPIILGKGKCKYLKKGDTLAIEIKTGSKDYLRGQKEHLKFQTKAHKEIADVSIIITTKDIYELKDEEGFRELFKEECSHIIAMLPKKIELDKYVIDSMELS